MTSKVRTRSANFTLTEKHLLKELLKEYLHILNKKNVNKFTWLQKQHAWDEICSTFNKLSTVGVIRSKSSLQKLYVNNLRKDISESESDDREIDDPDVSEAEDGIELRVKSESIQEQVDFLSTMSQNKLNNHHLNSVSQLKFNRNHKKLLSLQKAKLKLRKLREEYETEIAEHNLAVSRLNNQADFQRESLKLLQSGGEILKTMLIQVQITKVQKLKELEEMAKFRKIV